MNNMQTDNSNSGSLSLFERLHRFWNEIHKPEFTGDGLGADYTMTPGMNIKIGKILKSSAKEVGAVADIKTSIKLLAAEDSCIRGITSEASSGQIVPANVMAPCVLVGVLAESFCAEIVTLLVKANNIEDIVISKAAQAPGTTVPEKVFTYNDCKILGSYYRFSREWVFAFTYNSVRMNLTSFKQDGSKQGAKSTEFNFVTREAK